MGWKTILQLIGIAVSIFMLSGCATASDSMPQEESRPYPNIVFILADDMGYGDPGCYNPESKIPTPNMDSLAGQGIRFTDAHSPSSVCTPTRYGVLTGRYAWRSRLKKAVLWSWDKPLLEKDRMTVPEMLKQQGYSTACIGKWHLGWNWPTKDGSIADDQFKPGEYVKEKRNAFGQKVDFSRPIKGGPLDHGFDYYFGDDVPNFPPYCFIENDRLLGIPSEEKPQSMFGSPGPMLPGWKLADVMPAITKKATDYIRNQAKQPEGKPFFLYFSLTAPHTPIVPADEFHGKSQAGRYGDYVYQVDWSIGQVLKELKEQGLRDNTLVIVTSDNGSPARDGANDGGKTGSVLKLGHNPSGGLRGIKADAWEGGHRVPFIARWPGKIKAGSVSHETVCLVDFMATVASALNIELPDNAAEDSYNILPALIGQSYDSPIREATVHHSIQGVFCIRQGKWKYIDGVGSGGWSGKGDGLKGQLYDMEADLAESNNLYKSPEHQAIIRELKTLLKQYKTQGRSRPLQTKGS